MARPWLPRMPLPKPTRPHGDGRKPEPFWDDLDDLDDFGPSGPFPNGDEGQDEPPDEDDNVELLGYPDNPHDGSDDEC